MTSCDTMTQPRMAQPAPALLLQDAVWGAGAVTQGWQTEAMADFAAHITDKDFPCLFGRKAWAKGAGFFAFVPQDAEHGCDSFAAALGEYTEFVHNVPLDARLLMPLVVFFEPPKDTPAQALLAYGWEMLNRAHRRDLAPWPADVPTDPDHPDWSYCFNGVPLFVNMSAPVHQILRNRNLGRYLVFVINPRENFDAVASHSNRSGRLVRENIRNRIAAWNDGIVPPELGFYGETDNREWTQYQLEEPTVPRPQTCPFHNRAQTDAPPPFTAPQPRDGTASATDMTARFSTLLCTEDN